eukprot:3534096-Pyramimonas_sp.AAC.1
MQASMHGASIDAWRHLRHRCMARAFAASTTCAAAIEWRERPALNGASSSCLSTRHQKHATTCF